MSSIIKVDTIQDQDGNNIINENSNTITIGASGDTITLASGASQTGFGREGSVDWQTGSIKTSTFTAASGEGYFVNSGSALTMNLPAGSAGAIVAISDYARNFATYNLTISANGSEKIGGEAQDATLNVSGQAATFVYVDSTKGWINVQNAEDTETGVSPFVAATGGTITTSGDYKIHTFTGPGTFCVSSAGTPGGYTKLDYLVVAGGGGSGGNSYHIQGGGGGGAGGFRESRNPAIAPAWSASPLVTCASLTASVGAIPVTVGAGGDGGRGAPNPTYSSGWPGAAGTSGSNSIFSTITSTGGGRGAQPANNPTYPSTGPGTGAAQNGGSGGGESGGNPGSGMGTGNTPPTTPPQGSSGGSGDTTNYTLGGGGGGATAVGGSAPSNCTGASGGAGATTSINASPGTYSTGGNGSKPVPSGAAGNASVNTGNGGPANNYYPSPSGGSLPTYNGFNGGSGIVIIRYKFQ